ncbi:hypothetical protein Pfo_010647 [Paulownia fortunei]|nr:hypothetical protein Pfo_010647 [Paulownia fortunei]
MIMEICWRSEHIWIELIMGSRKLSNFCWALIQIIFFFSQGIVMSFYGIAGLFISSYLWCTISWNVGFLSLDTTSATI